MTTVELLVEDIRSSDFDFVSVVEEKESGYFVSLDHSYDGGEPESRVDEWKSLFKSLGQHRDVEKVVEVGKGWMFFTEDPEQGDTR